MNRFFILFLMLCSSGRVQAGIDGDDLPPVDPAQVITNVKNAAPRVIRIPPVSWTLNLTHLDQDRCTNVSGIRMVLSDRDNEDEFAILPPQYQRI